MPLPAFVWICFNKNYKKEELIQHNTKHHDKPHHRHLKMKMKRTRRAKKVATLSIVLSITMSWYLVVVVVVVVVVGGGVDSSGGGGSDGGVDSIGGGGVDSSGGVFLFLLVMVGL